MIDDEPGICGLLGPLLRRKGYEVVLTESEGKGLELFGLQQADVIVLALNMAGLGGLEVLEELRRFNLKQPVIIATGAGAPEAEHQVRALEVTESLEKKFRCIC